MGFGDEALPEVFRHRHIDYRRIGEFQIVHDLGILVGPI